MLTKTVVALETQAVLNKDVANLEAEVILTENVDTLDHSGGRDKVAKPATTCQLILHRPACPAHYLAYPRCMVTTRPPVPATDTDGRRARCAREGDHVIEKLLACNK